MKKYILLSLSTLLFSLNSIRVPATPLLALKSSNQCASCHNPGRTEKPLLQRRCTLDCQGCHVDPNGAGPRNQWGYYYAHDALSSVNFLTPKDPLQDESYFDIHFDSRVISRSSEGESRKFPMNREFSLRLRPFVRYLHLTYQANFLGRIEDQELRYLKDNPQRFHDKYSIMIDNLPLNLYLRAFRSYPIYGVRRTNHSNWIRERIGLNQFALTEGYAIGGTPTVPFVHYSIMKGDPRAKPEDKQVGSSFHGGFRGVSFGWHINTSLWSTKSKKASINMQAVGGGAKIFDFVLMAEKNWRKVKSIDVPLEELYSYESPALRLHPSSVIEEVSLTYVGVRGVDIGLVHENMSDENSIRSRKSFYIDLHPIPYLQFEFWRRHESGSRNLWDTLAVAHLYGDL